MKESQAKYLSIITTCTDVFDNNCKLIAARIEELYTNENSIFSYEIELEELAQFYHRKLIEKNFNNDDMVKIPKKATDTYYQEVDLFSFTSASSLQIGGEYLCSQAIEELQIPQFLSHQGFNPSQVTNNVLEG